MPRTKLSVPDVAEAGPALWSNAIRAGDMLFISGQVARPFEGGTDLTESYAITDAAAQTAAYVAPFTGIHGWYWQNRNLEPVTLTLDATGAFTGSKIFDQTGEHDRALEPPAE